MMVTSSVAAVKIFTEGLGCEKWIHGTGEVSYRNKKEVAADFMHGGDH